MTNKKPKKSAVVETDPRKEVVVAIEDLDKRQQALMGEVELNRDRRNMLIGRLQLLEEQAQAKEQ